jgi:hypothetical protein
MASAAASGPLPVACTCTRGCLKSGTLASMPAQRQSAWPCTWAAPAHLHAGALEHQLAAQALQRRPGRLALGCSRAGT